MGGRLYQRGTGTAFEETAYLLLFGNLPDRASLTTFKGVLDEYRVLPKGFTEDMILAAPSNDNHE
jgi:citrate synthase